MFEKVMPEQVGISSAIVKEFVEYLEKKNLSTHSIIMARHDKIFTKIIGLRLTVPLSTESILTAKAM